MINYRRPLSSGEAPDPYVICYGGYYYSLYTESTRLTLRRSKKLEEVYKGEENVVYTAGHEVFDCIWAPEMLHLHGKWYIYSSGSTSAEHPHDFNSIRMFCLESDGPDIFGSYHFKAFTDPDIYAIDQSVFYDRTSEKLYVAYVQILPATGNTILLAEMKNPWTISNRRAIIHNATYPWECRCGKVTEGPFFLDRRAEGGTLQIIYSANDTWSPYYGLGVLELRGGDMLDRSSWYCYPEAIFNSDIASSAEDKIYAPGHASIFYIGSTKCSFSGLGDLDLAGAKSPDESAEGWYLAHHGCLETEHFKRLGFISPFNPALTNQA